MQDSEAQFYEQIKDKISKVFQKKSTINSTHPFEAFVVLLFLAIWPLLEELQNQSFQITFRILIVSLYLGFSKKNKKFNNYKTMHAYLITFVGFIIQLFSALQLAIENQGNLHCQCLLITAIFITYICLRFQIEKIRWISYSQSILGLIIQIFLQVQVLQALKFIILIIIVVEGTQWRIRENDREYKQILQEFNQELEIMKEASLKEMNKLQDNIESPTQQQFSSRANQLLKKLRLIKYQQLLNKNEDIQYGIKKSKKQQVEFHKNNSLRQLPDSNLEEQLNNNENNFNNIFEYPSQNNDSVAENNEQSRFFKRKPKRMMTSATDQIYNISISNSFSDKKNEEISLSINDLDDLLNLLSGKKEQIWLPKFLRSNQMITDQGFSLDAKKFLLSHFTEKQASFEYIAYQGTTQEQFMDEKLDFNQDYIQYQKLCFKVDQNQSRIFIETTLSLFKRFKMQESLKILNIDILRDFIWKVDSLYMNTFYHNSMHALDVTNATGFFLENGLSNEIDDLEQNCLLISSLAHDIGHPGLNNGFMMSNCCKLALLYNDQSVLENYHSFLLFQILQQDQYNLINHLGRQEQKAFRKYCLTLILDTDLTRHFQLMNKFQNYIELSESQAVDKHLVMSICIKCADVGHGAKQLRLHKLWSRRIIEEFFIQGDLELFLKVPISPMCDRNQSVAKSQEGFLKAIVLPMFNAFTTLMQNEILKTVCIRQIQENIQYWQEQQKDDQFLQDTHFDRPDVCIEYLKKYLNQPIQLSV